MNLTARSSTAMGDQRRADDVTLGEVSPRQLIACSTSGNDNPPPEEPDESLDIEPSGEEEDSCFEDVDVPPDGDRDWAAEDAEIEDEWHRRLREDPELRFWEQVRKEEDEERRKRLL